MKLKTVKKAGFVSGVALGSCLLVVGMLLLGLAMNLVVALVLGLLAHLIFPQFGYWHEVGAIYLMAILLSLLASGGGKRA